MKKLMTIDYHVKTSVALMFAGYERTFVSPGLISRGSLSDCSIWTIHCSNREGCKNIKNRDYKHGLH